MAKRVYFAFHYQDVIDFRANVVRNHKLTKDLASAGYYDASIWEESEKKGDLAIKRMINGEIQNTSVTAVLVGSQTYARRWVRYEIMKSVERGNGTLGVHINGITGKDKKTKIYGPNPFEYLALVISSDGKTASPREWNGSKWIVYNDLGDFSIPQLDTSFRGKQFQLTKWLPLNDWIADKGFENFNTWIS